MEKRLRQADNELEISIKNTIPFLQSELQSSNTTSEKIALPTIKRPKSVLD